MVQEVDTFGTKEAASTAFGVVQTQSFTRVIIIASVATFSHSLPPSTTGPAATSLLTAAACTLSWAATLPLARYMPLPARPTALPKSSASASASVPADQDHKSPPDLRRRRSRRHRSDRSPNAGTLAPRARVSPGPSQASGAVPLRSSPLQHRETQFSRDPRCARKRSVDRRRWRWCCGGGGGARTQVW